METTAIPNEGPISPDEWVESLESAVPLWYRSIGQAHSVDLLDELTAGTENREAHSHDGHDDHEHSGTHEASHDHHSAERSAHPNLWRRIGGFLLGASAVELALETAHDSEPRAAVGLDVLHTVLADVPDYLARGEFKSWLLGSLAAGRILADREATGTLGGMRQKVTEKLTAGAMIAGNTAALGYTGYSFVEDPGQYHPLEFSGYDAKSYLAPSVGLAAVSLAARMGRKLKGSSSHADHDGLEHIELDRGDAEGKLIFGAMLPSELASAAAVVWYSCKGIKFAVKRLWKGEHNHGEHNEPRTRFWRKLRFAVGGLALVGTLAFQGSHEPGEGVAGAPEAAEADDPSDSITADLPEVNLSEAPGSPDPEITFQMEPEASEAPGFELFSLQEEWNSSTGEGSIWGELRLKYPDLSDAEINDLSQRTKQLNGLIDATAKLVQQDDTLLFAKPLPA